MLVRQAAAAGWQRLAASQVLPGWSDTSPARHRAAEYSNVTSIQRADASGRSDECIGSLWLRRSRRSGFTGVWTTRTHRERGDPSARALLPRHRCRRCESHPWSRRTGGRGSSGRSWTRPEPSGRTRSPTPDLKHSAQVSAGISQINQQADLCRDAGTGAVGATCLRATCPHNFEAVGALPPNFGM